MFMRCNGRVRPEDDRRPRSRFGAFRLRRSLLILLMLISRGDARYSGGDGTPEDPYLIASAQDLLTLAAEPEDWRANFKLVADLDMSDVPPDTFQAIGDVMVPFSGLFDGAARKIRHLRCVCPGRDSLRRRVQRHLETRVGRQEALRPEQRRSECGCRRVIPLGEEWREQPRLVGDQKAWQQLGEPAITRE